MKKLYCSFLLLAVFSVFGADPAQVHAGTDGIAGSGDIISYSLSANSSL